MQLSCSHGSRCRCSRFRCGRSALPWAFCLLLLLLLRGTLPAWAALPSGLPITLRLQLSLVFRLAQQLRHVAHRQRAVLRAAARRALDCEQAPGAGQSTFSCMRT
jgi:hypothetical protein